MLGLRFGERDHSRTLDTPSEGCTTSTLGTLATSAIGARSLPKSKGERRDRGVDGIGDGRHQQRVAVLRRARDVFGGDAGAGARPVLDHDLLAEEPAHAGAHGARREVGDGAGPEADDDAHRTVRVVVGGERPARRRGRQARSPRPISLPSSAPHPPWLFSEFEACFGSSRQRHASIRSAPSGSCRRNLAACVKLAERP